MPRSPRLLAYFAMLIAAVVVAAGDASGAAREAGLADATRPRTIAVTPLRIGELAADGRRLAWGDGFQRIQIFDRVTHRVTSLAHRLCGEATAMKGPVLAGKRVVFGCEWGSNTGVAAAVYTAALDDRRARLLKSWEVSREAGDVGELYGPPLRIAGAGGALAFFGFDGSWERPHAGVWRLFGRRAVWLHYGSLQQLLIDIAVAGRRLATAEWVTRCGCDSLPAWSPDGREIAWNHGGTIWLMRSDGTGQRRLSGHGFDPGTGPRWSPGGSTLAFAGQGNVYLIDGDGTNQRKLVAGDYPAWSPDGTRLAFVRANDLWIVNTDGSGERRLTSNGLETTSRPDWSPDGRSLVVARAGDIYLVDAESGGERDLTPGDRPESSPVWSPDGSAIAFAQGYLSNNCCGGSIYVVRPDGSGLTRLSDGETRDTFDQTPAWSPDSSRIAYLRSMSWSDDQEIRIVGVDGRGQKKLQSRDGAGAPAWSPDGRTIASGDSASGFDAVNRGHSGIYAIDPAGGRSRWLAAPTKPTSEVALRDSRTGKPLRFLQLPGMVSSVALSSRYVVARAWRRDLGYVLEGYDLTSGTALRTMRFPRSGSAVSLVGRWGVYRVGPRIRLLDVKTGRTSMLAIAGKGAVGPVIDGNRVFWAENYGMGSRVREIVLG
jgi:Tol biopolymer transport system component